ncbi:MAG: hotdog domain-containing protein, partial [Pseudomonadota bacterium]
VVFVVRRIAAEYLRPARFDDLITVETRVLSVTGARIGMEQTVMRRDDTLLTADLTLACMALDGQVLRIPPDLRAKLAVGWAGRSG